jgi:hypothetical protein
VIHNVVCTAVAMERRRDRRTYKALSVQQIGKHVHAATDKSAAIEELSFLCGSCREVISKGQNELRSSFVKE